MSDTVEEHAGPRAGFGPGAMVAVALAAFTCGSGAAWLALRPFPGANGLAGGFHDPSVLFPAPAASMMEDAAPAQDAALPDVETMIGALAARLKAAPDDPEGWKMLGWSYSGTGRHAEAAEAYGRAAELLPPDADLLSLRGEALVRAGGNRVTDEASGFFGESLTLDPANTRSLYYRGLGLAQSGDPGEALEIWLPLLAATPEDAPWRDDLRAGIGQAARAAGVDLSVAPGLAGSD